MKQKRSVFGNFLIYISILIFAAGLLLNFLDEKILNSLVDSTTVANQPSSEPKSTPLSTPRSTPNPQTFIGRSIKVPILTYHYIGNNPNPEFDKTRDNLSVSPTDFESQLEYLKNNDYTPITLDTMYAGLMGLEKLPEKSIVLTFDDGYIDFFVNAYPILKKYNFKATSFIPTGLIGQGYYLTWEQIQEMQKSGLTSFQAHSINHPNLTLLDPLSIKVEVLDSKKELEQRLNSIVNFFCYPYGASSTQIQGIVQSSGYIGAVGTWNGSIISEGNLYNMPRIKIPGGISTEQFANLIQE